MNKYLRVIMAVLCLTMLLIPISHPVLAADVYASYWSLDAYTYTFGSGSGLPNPFDFIGQGHYFGFSADGETAYCVDRTSQVPGGTQTVYDDSWGGFSDSTKRNVALIMLYGYDGYTRYGFSSDTERAATQMAVWAATHAILGSSIEGLYREHAISGYYRGDVLVVYDRIIEQLKSHYTIPSFASSSSSSPKVYTAGYDATTKLHTVTITDSSNVYSYFNIVQALKSAGYGVTTSGNRITITSSTPFNQSNMISGVRISNSSVSSLLIRDISYLAGNNVQAKVMVTGTRHTPDSVRAYFALRSGTGSIVIQKTDSFTNEAVGQAVFEVRDKTGRVYGTITTDEKGTGRLNNLVYGEYIVVETEAAFGYQPNENIYEVVVNNETTTVAIENDYKMGRLHLTKISSFDGKILPNATYGLYTVDDNQLMEELTTDNEGKATSEFVRFGEYYIQELVAPARYYIDIDSYSLTLGEEHGTTSEFIAEDAPIIGVFTVHYAAENNPKLYVGDALDVPNTGVDYVVTDDMTLNYPEAPRSIATNRIDNDASQTSNTNKENQAMDIFSDEIRYMTYDANQGESDTRNGGLLSWHLVLAICTIPIFSSSLFIVLRNHKRRRKYYI